LARQLMEVEVCELIGAERGERTEDRATHRNGYRARRWDTRAGEIELQIPKIRQGSYSRASCSRASVPSRRCSAWSSRPMCAACRPGAWTSSSRASGCGSAAARSAASAPGWMSRCRRFERGRWRAATSQARGGSRRPDRDYGVL
jgi:hypothetical protein